MSETSTGWQPIETAPRDGTWILLWDDHLGLAVSGCWYDYPGINTPDDYEAPWSFWTADNDLISFWVGGDDYYSPTHWMPLPPAPTQRWTP